MRKLKNFLFFLFNKIKLKKKKFYIKTGTRVENARIVGAGRTGRNTDLRSSTIGFGSYVGSNCNMFGSKIGKFCSLGNNIKIVRGDHPSRNYVSTSPTFYSKILRKEGLYFENYKEFSAERKTKKGFSAEIGNDVWIGDNVTIIGGIVIGNGVIIGAGSVVTKDISSYSIVGGVPAKEIRKRFTEEEIEFLEKFKWWDKDIKWLEKNVVLFSDIKLFMKKVKGD